MASDSDRLSDVADTVFGWPALRHEQLAAMEAILAGRDVLAVMPTGSGKSAIYQVPAVLLERPVIVISPLIALQHDQIAALAETGAPEAVAINSRESAKALERGWTSIDGGRARYIFVGPEQLQKDDVMRRLAAAQPSLVVIDEAHCVSAWGHEFRPSYLRVGDAIARLNRPPVAALTATASAVVRREICEFLGLIDPLTISGGFDRPNIELAVRHHTHDTAKRADVVGVVAGLERPGLLYCATRKDTEFYAGQLTERGLSAVSYHAGLTAAQRSAVHDRFRDDDTDVVVATSAFGMGIDKPDVRYVVHASVPDSVDAYYQQIGRAGRDGAAANAMLFYRPEDLSLGNFFATRTADEDLLGRVYAALDPRKPVRLKNLGIEDGRRRVTAAINLLEQAGAVTSDRSGFTRTAMSAAQAVAKAVAMAEIGERVDHTRVEMMRSYAETPDCRRQFLLGYFGEQLPNPCGNCDPCRSEAAVDRGEPAIAVGSAVEHTEWGAGTVLGGDPDRITVLFDLYGYRTLAVDALEEHDLLHLR
jgi:ATP-dependent DNA helicase RecQ